MFASTSPQQKERQEEVSARAVSPDPDSGLLQSLIEALPDPCVVVDTGGRVLAVNRKWKELPRSHETASAARNPIGINYPALFKSLTHDQDWESVVTALKSVLSGYCEHVEHEYLRPTPNSFLWFRMSIRAWRQLGASALIFHRDITTEKLGPLTTRTVEQEFRTLADSSPVLIWTRGPKKDAHSSTGRGWNLPGYRRNSWEAGGCSSCTQTIARKSSRTITPRSWRKANSSSTIACDTKMAAIAGSEMGSVRFDSQNQLCGFIGSAWDPSQQKQATEEAHRAARNASLACIIFRYRKWPQLRTPPPRCARPCRAPSM